MPTYNQLCRKKRKKKKKLNKTPALEKCPQKKGICTKLILRTPKKPNSALRKLAKLRLTNKKLVYGSIPGEGHLFLRKPWCMATDVPEVFGALDGKVCPGISDCHRHGVTCGRNAKHSQPS